MADTLGVNRNQIWVTENSNQCAILKRGIQMELTPGSNLVDPLKIGEAQIH